MLQAVGVMIIYQIDLHHIESALASLDDIYRPTDRSDSALAFLVIWSPMASDADAGPLEIISSFCKYRPVDYLAVPNSKQLRTWAPSDLWRCK